MLQPLGNTASHGTLLFNILLPLALSALGVGVKLKHAAARAKQSLVTSGAESNHVLCPTLLGMSFCSVLLPYNIHTLHFYISFPLKIAMNSQCHFTAGETEALGGEVTCPRPPGRPVAETGIEPMSPDNPALYISQQVEQEEQKSLPHCQKTTVIWAWFIHLSFVSIAAGEKWVGRGNHTS